MKFIDIIDKSLKTPVTPLGYLVNVHSLIFAGAFVFFGTSESVRSTLLWQIGALIGVQAWGIIAFIGAVICLAGLIKKNTWLVNIGSFIMFSLWLFAAIAYFTSGLWLQGILAFVTMNYFGYFNMAASMGRLWDYTPALTSLRE